MILTNSDSIALKAQLNDSIKNLNEQESLYPSSERGFNTIIQQIEELNPIANPLQAENFSYLVGNWKLIYTSNGTEVTRGIDSVGNTLKNSLEIKKIWQHIYIDQTEKISSDNNALLELPVVGEYCLSVNGYWKPKSDYREAIVTFSDASLQATRFFGQENWTLPKLSVYILEFFRREALWITTYLDEDLRINRGATGNTFVFSRL